MCYSLVKEKKQIVLEERYSYLTKLIPLLQSHLYDLVFSVYLITVPVFIPDVLEVFLSSIRENAVAVQAQGLVRIFRIVMDIHSGSFGIGYPKYLMFHRPSETIIFLLFYCYSVIPQH